MPKKYTFKDVRFITLSYVSVIGRPSYDEPDKYPPDYDSKDSRLCAYDELIRRTEEDPDYWQVVKCEDCGSEIAPDLDSGNFLYARREGKKVWYLDGYYQCECGSVLKMTRGFLKGVSDFR